MPLPITKPRLVSLTTYLQIGVVIVDQLSKKFIAEALTPPHLDHIEVAPFLSFVLTYDHGTAFVFGAYDLARLASYILGFLELVLFFVLSRWRLHTRSRLASVAIGLGMGGIISLMFDRLRFGAVTDFIDLHINDYHFFSFNVAEVAIFLCVILLALDIVIGERPKDISNSI